MIYLHILALEAEQKELDQGMSINEELRVQQALLTDKVKQLNADLNISIKVMNVKQAVQQIHKSFLFY